MRTGTELRCDMAPGCAEPVTRVDSDGYVYCDRHGIARKDSGRNCRKLRPWELRRLQRRGTIKQY